MKKNNLKNYFKFGIFLFGISLLLWNCEKETNNDFVIQNQASITIEEVQKVFDSSFNKNKFRNLPENPLWENSKAFYGENNMFYLEIPFYQINKEDRDLSTSISFDKLLAYKDANDKITLKIVHYFALKNDNGILDFDLITHSELLKYSGFLTFYDLNKNVLDIKQYLNGVDTNKTITIKDENDSSFSREDETGYQYSETTCTRGCWYWEYSNGIRVNLHCSAWSCTTTTYYTGGGGSNGGGNSSGTSYNTNENIDHIDDDNLTDPKIKCLNSYLNSQGNKFIKSIINNFAGESTTNIKIESQDRVYNKQGEEVSGVTRIRNGEITIQINASIASSRKSLEVVRTLIHEYIHADMYRKLYEIDNEIHEYPDFKKTYDAYKSEKFQATVQHNTMAELYIFQMRDALKNFHKNVLSSDYDYIISGPTPITDDFYEALAWRGLKETNVEAYNSLSETKKQALENALTQHFSSTTSNCPNN